MVEAVKAVKALKGVNLIIRSNIVLAMHLIFYNLREISLLLDSHSRYNLDIVRAGTYAAFTW